MFRSCPPPNGIPDSSSRGASTPFGKLGTPALSSLLYDPGAHQAKNNLSVGPGQYVLGPVGAHCQPCLTLDPRINAQHVGDSLCQTQSMVDTESELMNLTRPATRAPCGLYRGDGGQPTVCGAPLGGKGGAALPYPVCNAIPTVDTRLVNPPCTLRGTGINRFEWLCQDPQKNALMPFDANIDTSIVTKDAHRPFLARPIDQTLALPNGNRDLNPGYGAPDWIPKCGGAVGAVDEPPTMLFRSCAEIDRISNGCR